MACLKDAIDPLFPIMPVSWRCQVVQCVSTAAHSGYLTCGFFFVSFPLSESDSDDEAAVEPPSRGSEEDAPPPPMRCSEEDAGNLPVQLDTSTAHAAGCS